MAQNGYANAVLVSTEWLAEHLGEDGLVVAEVNENPDLYERALVRWKPVPTDTLPKWSGIPVARVLVADPDPDVLALVERAVTSWGHEVVRYRPDEVPAPPDVMLFEPQMGPRVVELAERLAAEPRHVPLVVVSISPPELAVHRLRPAAYLLKPFSLLQLQAALLKALPTDTGTG